jgi:hypothetical protein
MGQLRGLLPHPYRAHFDDDADTFTSDGEISRCGVLMAFSWSFDRLIRANKKEAIGAVLDAVEGLLREFGPQVVGPAAQCGIWNDIAACFLENVLPTTPAGHPLVVPQMGPLARECVEPRWLLPDPNATLAT